MLVKMSLKYIKKSKWCKTSFDEYKKCSSYCYQLNTDLNHSFDFHLITENKPFWDIMQSVYITCSSIVKKNMYNMTIKFTYVVCIGHLRVIYNTENWHKHTGLSQEIFNKLF